MTDDGPPSTHHFPDVPTLADQLVAGGVSVSAYAESLPAAPTNDSGLYAVRHNPWAYFPNAPVTVKDSSNLIPDLNSNAPPDFVWYSPNITDDGHTGVPTDTSAHELADSESFLSSFIPSVQATTWYKAGGQIIIEWDEGLSGDTAGINGSNGGHVATIVVSKYLAASPGLVFGECDHGGDPRLH
ncbi:MAG TPA: alkaline phosphatase family protein [Acidimicrobiales bacterium]|nr:alkaline phosphatase family protein [Acidimicrobiales bacterium]